MTQARSQGWWSKVTQQLAAVAAAVEYDPEDAHRREIDSLSRRLQALEDAQAERETRQNLQDT